LGGTTFCGADLTQANFTGALLKSTSFHRSPQNQTNLTQVCWRDAKQLDKARVGDSILLNPEVRNLLVCRDGHDEPKKYLNANLRGANLNGVNLKGATLTGADLSYATLHHTDLRHANLREVMAIGSDFSHAHLTAACLEGWNIDHTTTLAHIDCQFIFRLEQPNEFGSRERLPHDSDKIFQPGDFEKYFKEVLDTVQLLIRRGATPQDFRAAFEALMQNHNVTADDVQGWQRKGDDLLVTVQVPIGTDKGSVEREFDQVMEARLEAAKTAGRLEGEQRRADSFEQFSLALVNSLPNLVPKTISATAMNDSNNPNISAPAGSFINTGTVTNSTGSTINLGTISGAVTNTINQLPASPDPDQPGIKELLTQLQATIADAQELSTEDKTDALEQVQAIAELGKNPQHPDKESIWRKAKKILTAPIPGLPETATVFKAIGDILPAIAKLLSVAV